MNEDNKIKLEELAPYLPYGLNGQFLLSDVISLRVEKDEIRLKKLTPDNVKFFELYCKPILRPIEDLYNEETDCGIKIVHYFNFKTNVKLDCRNFPYHVVEQLFKNHFDVFGLIDKGLAISYNDLIKSDS
jgi:hypothetical protein